MVIDESFHCRSSENQHCKKLRWPPSPFEQYTVISKVLLFLEMFPKSTSYVPSVESCRAALLPPERVHPEAISHRNLYYTLCSCDKNKFHY